MLLREGRGRREREREGREEGERDSVEGQLEIARPLSDPPTPSTVSHTFFFRMSALESEFQQGSIDEVRETDPLNSSLESLFQLKVRFVPLSLRWNSRRKS